MSIIYDIVGGTRSELVMKMPWDEYRAVTAMNPSILVHGLESMKALHWAWCNPSPSTPAMEFGTALHTLCLEPREFTKRYAIWEGSRRTKEYREYAVDAWEQKKRVLTGEELEQLQTLATAVLAHEELQGLIRSGQSEVAVFSSDCGVQCKGRIDWISGPEATAEVILDLKTSNNVSEVGRGKAFYKFHYDVKLGLYQRWVYQVTGRRLPVVICWAENKPPYDVVIDEGWIPQPVLDAGVMKAIGVFAKLTPCLESCIWPGHGGPLWTPNWEMDNDVQEWHDEQN